MHRCERLLEHLNVDVGHGSVGEVDQTSTVVDTTSVQPMKRNSISNHYENALPTTSVLRFNDLSGMPVNDEDLGLVPRSNRNVSADERCWTTTMGGIGDTNRHNSSTGHSDGTYLEMSASNSLSRTHLNECKIDAINLNDYVNVSYLHLSLRFWFIGFVKCLARIFH